MKKSVLIFLAVALFGSGCSTVSLLYRNADWYLQHRIDGYVSFNAGQEATIRRDISVYLDWHRKHALPEYIVFLQNLNGAAQYDGLLQIGRIAQLRAQLLDLYHQTLRPAVRPAAELLSSLDSRQIRELSDNLAKENSKQMQELQDLGRKAYLDKRADDTLDFLEGLVGKLSRDQRKQVREMSRHLPSVREIYLEQRYTNQRRLISMLNEHAGADRIASFISLWLMTPDATRTSQQQIAIHSFETADDEMIAHIQWMLTARQKAHLNKQLSRYIDELRKLSSGIKSTGGGSVDIPAEQSRPGGN
ncbi:MAG: DUF6279 family lipoprotein [Gallionella sp.]|nr:DUF6279 family lipoprotein [Gallionella sp.]